MKQQVILSEYSDDLLLPDYELSWQEREYLTKASIIHEKSHGKGVFISTN